MMGFIEVHTKTNTPVIVNLRHVEEVRPNSSGAIIYMDHNEGYEEARDFIVTRESFREVKDMIVIATGGKV